MLTDQHDLLPSQASNTEKIQSVILCNHGGGACLLVNRCRDGRTPRFGHGTTWRQRMAWMAWTRAQQQLQHLSLARRSVMAAFSSEQLQQAVQQAVATAAQHWQQAAAQMHQEIGTQLKRYHYRLLLESGERLAGPTLNAALAQSEASRSTQLCYMLVMLYKGTALTRVVNAGAQEGLEAWRCLVLHHEPTSLTRSACLLQELLNFSFVGETVARMAQFDRDIDRNEERERRDVPREHPYRRCSSHVARRTVGTTLCPQQCSVDHVGDSESRDRQCQTRTSCGQLDTTTDGSVGVWHARARLLPERQVARQRQRKGQGQSQGQCSDDAMPDLWQGWSLEERLLVQHPKRTSPRTRARAKMTTNTQQQPNKDKNSVKCWHCNGTGHYSKDCPKKKQSWSAVESQEQPSSSGATGETTVEWFLLECLRGRQLRIQDRGCLGDWHRQWCCEIGCSCWRDSWLPRREGQRKWSCVFEQGK